MQEVELSCLAQELVDFDRMAPETWCVVGNCFSLQKEHDTALKLFRRATQLNPLFTYAYTLSGHEYVTNDELEKASSSFRTALQTDKRHYNAWYGLGVVYFRQQQYAMAQYHFQQAIKINGSSSILYTFLGLV
jgi:anaphase-promoting complex subunit 3